MKRRRIHQVMTIAAVVAVGVASSTCGDQSDAAREARRVFVDASPSSSETCWAGSAQRTAEAFEMTCELNLGTDWSEYKRRLRSRMESRFSVRSETNESIVFSRELEGDVYSVSAALTKNSAEQSVRITFRAAPW